MENSYVPIKFRNGRHSEGELAAVQPVLNVLLDMRKSDFENMPTHVLPSGNALNLRPVPGGFIQASLLGLIARISSAFEPGAVGTEPLYDVEVWIDGNMAVAWTPFDFYLASPDKETRLTHVGTDICFLAKVEGTWKWCGLTDNCRMNNVKGQVPHRYEGPESQDAEEEKLLLGIWKEVIARLCKHDFERIGELIFPGSKFSLWSGTEVVFLTVDEFVVHCHDNFDGKVVKQELLNSTIRIDDDVAMIWSPVRVVIDGKATIGTEMVSLAKLGGKWLITGLGNNHGALV